VTAAEDERALLGRVLADRYRIDGLLGTGGMGAVYRGQHATLNRPVAIKVLAQSVSSRPDMVKRFEREAQAISMLDHPNCVQVLDYGTTEDGIQFLVMPLLHGAELRELLVRPLGLERGLAIADQVLQALEHAHRRGIVHRDLKPENVFIVAADDGREMVKLVDFGVVKLLGDEAEQERLTRAGVVFGTPMYMSPEQAAGSKVDGRSDLYSVGILLFEMLTGRPPFVSEDPSVLARMQLVSPPPPLPASIPGAVQAVILRLLSKTRDDRYATAQQAREALAAVRAAPHPASSAATVVGSESMANAPRVARRTDTELYDSKHDAPQVSFEPPAVGRWEPLPDPAVPGSAQGATMLALPDPGVLPKLRVRRRAPWVVGAYLAGGLVLWILVWVLIGA